MCPSVRGDPLSSNSGGCSCQAKGYKVRLSIAIFVSTKPCPQTCENNNSRNERRMREKLTVQCASSSSYRTFFYASTAPSEFCGRVSDHVYCLTTLSKPIRGGESRSIKLPPLRHPSDCFFRSKINWESSPLFFLD